MPRYIAFLRGVSPSNASMPELRRCFETAGFSAVRTVLSSGNVVFTSDAAPPDVLVQQAEAAMRTGLGHSFDTIIRSAPDLQALLATDPFAGFDLAPTAKRVLTFLRSPGEARVPLPMAADGAIILKQLDDVVLTAYVPGAKGPVFMTLLERTFGRKITTRTLATVQKCVLAAGG